MLIFVLKQIPQDQQMIDLCREYYQNNKNELKKNIDQIISTNRFLSTSRNENISIEFARSNHLNKDFEGILFKIDDDPSLKLISFY